MANGIKLCRRTQPDFQDYRIDYGVMIAPDPNSDLYRRIVTCI
ncbi:hypothetical protein ANO14919_104260 [Xylariales sp. No.14919]|nr:hypothetical protein ANO14919_104260 [Xylariales sp. No.14919]